MPRRAGTGNNGKLQATVLKKCSTEYHRPETNRQCAGGTCQHTCQPSEIERCRHAWTVRYNVNGVQRDKSFRDEMDAARRVQYGTAEGAGLPAGADARQARPEQANNYDAANS
jgi:hypothetical protein